MGVYSQVYQGGGWRNYTQNSWIQTLYLHNHRRYFQVIDEPGTVGSPGETTTHESATRQGLDEDQIREILDNIPGGESSQSASPDQEDEDLHRDTPHWLACSGILGFINKAVEGGFSHIQLAAIINEGDTAYLTLKNSVVHWLRSQTKKLYDTSTQLRCKVLSDKQ